MADLTLESVTTGGAPPAQLGRITLTGDRLSGDTQMAVDLLEMLRRRFPRLSDAELHERLARDGWSNGAMRIAV